MRIDRPLLEVIDLKVEFPTRRGTLTAIDGISFSIAPGEVLGVVGESGAGKSLTGAAIIGLLDAPGRIAGGEIRLDGRRIDRLSPREMRRVRGREIGAIFQDPLTSLDPLYTVGRQLTETIHAHLGLKAAQARERAVELLRATGIPAPEERIDHYPHQFSGGMRQRVVIALALAAQPRLVIADEPTTALDVSIQAQVIALLRELCRDQGTAVMLITHDMGVIAETADRVAVMYAGRIAEIGPVADVIHRPQHPYTAGLMGSIPTIGEERDRLEQIDGAMPRLDAIPPGCAFNPRCPKVMPVCRERRPDPMKAGASMAACWLHAAQAGPGAPTADRLPSQAPRAASSAAARPDSSPRERCANGTPAGSSRPPRTGTLESAGSIAPAQSAASAGTMASAPATGAQPLLTATQLAMSFDVSLPWLNRILEHKPRQSVQAVDGVSFEIRRGETLALVGESGCGKSTVARMLVGLHRPTHGEIVVHDTGAPRAGGAPSSDGTTSGHDDSPRQAPAPSQESAPGARCARRPGAASTLSARRRLQMIFQDPYASLNPRWRVQDIVAEPIRVHRLLSDGRAIRDRVDELLSVVGLTPADAGKYPHQFSGGQRQRISIARALASEPEFLVCDEPTSALDVSVQAQVLNLMRELQRTRGLTYLFISHNLAVVHHVSDRVGVMYLGRMVELAPKTRLFATPMHPYTRLLLDAIPDIGMTGRARTPVAGEVPNPLSPPSGCSFHPRCPHADSRCRSERPKLRELPDASQVACHAIEEKRVDWYR